MEKACKIRRLGVVSAAWSNWLKAGIFVDISTCSECTGFTQRGSPLQNAVEPANVILIGICASRSS